MSGPIQNHYLPKAAHLRFFEDPEKPGYIWLYQRGKEPVLANVDKVAKERHLYSFVLEDGRFDTSLEKGLAELESDAMPILRRLNAAPGEVTLTASEEFTLAWLVAFQAVRTPAQRNMLQAMLGELTKSIVVAHAQDSTTFSRSVEKAKAAGVLPGDTDVEKVRAYVMGGQYRIETHERYVMLEALSQVDEIVWTFLMKRPIILRSLDVNFVTSDYPVLQIENPTVPRWYNGGFLMAWVLFPIGSRAALLWMSDDAKRPASGPDEVMVVRSRTLSPFDVRGCTRDVISQADKYVFGCENHPPIKALFDKTEPPKRFSVSGG